MGGGGANGELSKNGHWVEKENVLFLNFPVYACSDTYDPDFIAKFKKF